jgi:hypothetical protein
MNSIENKTQSAVRKDEIVRQKWRLTSPQLMKRESKKKLKR